MSTTSLRQSGRVPLPQLEGAGAEQDRERHVRRTMVALALLTLAALTAYLTWDVRGSWSYALDLRGRQAGALVVVGAAVGASSLVFQTIAGNRILTPGVMGFDSVYVLVQTVLVTALGSGALLLGVVPRFALNTAVLTAFGLLLFTWLFRARSRNLFVLVLVGIVMGTFFGSLTTLASRVLSPDDFLTLQQLTFASFTTVDTRLLAVTAVATVLGLAGMWPLLRAVDVIDLGRENAVALGVDYHRVVRRVLVTVTVLVAASAALVGPMLFLGLIVANLARQVVRSHRHTVLVPASALVGVLCCVVGQLLVTHLFDLRTTLSVVVNLVGGVYFLLLLMRTSRL